MTTTHPYRELAIALNAAESLWRPAACRLAAEPESWVEGSGARSSAALARQVGVPEPQLRCALELLPQAPRLARREEARAADLGAAILTRFDPDYPRPLLDLALPPPILYRKGTLPDLPAVAIVGTRRPDAYGKEVAELFAQALAQAGLTVVSGFARGIDAAAHRGALAASQGTTVAVLGCGLGVDYPSGHRELGERIADSGALISEFRCGLPPRPWHFPVRNRVIAALGLGTLVVQAATRSGSLITAHHALELGREVWAVPGSVFDERALGPNGLIRDGAPLVQHPRDILDTLRCPSLFRERASEISPAAAREPPPGLAGRLVQLLPRGACRAAEELAAESGAPLDGVLAELLELELAGWLRRVPGPAYRLVD